MSAVSNHLWPLMLPPDQYGLDEICTVSAHGVRLRFADGTERLDGVSGLWNTNLGYGNPAIAQATYQAMRDASYLSAWGYENVYARRAAAELVALAGAEHFDKVLFSTSGGAANDMAMKLVRHYHCLRGEPDRRIVLGLRDGFHGLTFGAAALTDARLGQRMYGVDRRLVGHVRANEARELATVLDRMAGRVAGVVVEPVLGTAAVPLTDDYLTELLRLRRRHGFLLVVDEVSTGFGRVGPGWFASQRWPEPPDVLITAKALTNGTLPASALIVSGAVAQTFVAGDAILGHAETQAGTAVVCAAISATIDETRRLDAVARGAKLAARLDVDLARIADELPLVGGVSGAGCLRALRLVDPAGGPLAQIEVAAVVRAIRRAGALVHPGPSCVQLLPALVYSDEDLDELLARVRAGLVDHAAARG